MPTISQLPAAVSVSASDEMPISQGGSVCAVLVGELLSSAQPVITVDSPSLIGRTSLGSGGPEQVDVGIGLYLSQGTVVANGTDHATFPATQTLLIDADLVISNRGSQMLMAADLLRGLFSAGQNITIDSSGVIDALTEGTIAAVTFSGGVVSSVGAADLVPINQAGTGHAVTYANFLNGITINEAPAAGPVSNTDALWVAQGANTLANQSFSAIWAWITEQMPTYATPVVEIETNCNLQAAVHSGRTLICSQPVTLTALNLASGFQCQVLNLSSGGVTLGTGFLTSTGSSTLSAGQSAGVQCVTYSGGTIVYAAMPQSTLGTVPGPVTGLSVTSASTSALTVGWEAPNTGGNPASYSVLYRLSGTTTWTVASSSTTATTYQISGLEAATGYDVEVQAANGSGTGPSSSVLNTLTAAPGVSVPSQVTGLTATVSSSTTVQLSWTTQTGANAASTYTLQYRVTGSSGWTSSVAGNTQNSYLLSGLLPSTSYDFSVFGVNAAGSGVASTIISATTPATIIAVPAQVTGLAATTNSSTQITLSWSGQSGTNAATSYTVQYRVTGSTAWTSSVPGITGTAYPVTGLTPSKSYDFSMLGVNAGGAGPVSTIVSAVTQNAGSSASSITWNVSPSGTYTHGSGAIGVNAQVIPSTAAVQFGFSTSSTIEPASWTAATLVNTNLWGAYVPTPPTAGTWYAWVEGTDGSCPTVFSTPFVVQ